jgi:hypothetical protein
MAYFLKATKDTKPTALAVAFVSLGSGWPQIAPFVPSEVEGCAIGAACLDFARHELVFGVGTGFA